MNVKFELVQSVHGNKCFTKFTNSTIYKCLIKFKPIPPKRTYTDGILIEPGTYWVFDNELLDLTRIAITFEEPND